MVLDSKKRIWEHLRDDIINGTKTLNEYLNNLPDELADQADTYYKELKTDMANLVYEVFKLHNETKDIPINELASVLKEKRPELSGCVFNMRNKKPFERSIIKLIEPKGV